MNDGRKSVFILKKSSLAGRLMIRPRQWTVEHKLRLKSKEREAQCETRKPPARQVDRPVLLGERSTSS